MSRHLLAAALVLAPLTAHAGGLARPNAGSARSVGQGGAFGAVADDPYCLHANPAGCASAALDILAGLELIYAPRSYRPADGSPSQDANVFAPAPLVGVLFKPGGEGSSVTLGVGAWNTFGGQAHWPEGAPNMPAINASTELVFELVPGIAYALDERFSIGATLRLGVGLFAVDATQKPQDTELSAVGLGVGAGLGVMYRPSDRVSIGATWRSHMDVRTTGSADIIFSGAPRNFDAEHVQHWPQQASLAAAFGATEALRLAVQVDWTQWSRFEALDITFPSEPGANQHFELDWSDSITARLGAQYTVSEDLAFRGGFTFDQNAVPDRTIERQYLDADKYGVSLGTSVRFSDRVALDAAVDVVGGPVRVVPQTGDDIPPEWGYERNIAPGEHEGQVFTLGTAVRIAL